MSKGPEEAPRPLPLFLHIGMHKTGSTSLQLRLFNDADKLKRSGILYPCGRFQRFAFQHSSIVDLVSRQTSDELTSLLRGIHEEAVASGCYTAILSGERISTLPGPRIALLRDAVLSAGFVPTVVVFSRPYLEWVRSIVSERMRAPGVFVTPAQIAQFLDRNDAADVRARFTSAFGADNLVHHELSGGEDCVTLFERDVGLAESPPTQRANSRIDFATLNWLNAVKAELDVPARIVQNAYDAAFERPSSISSAEAAFLTEVADGLSSAKGGLLKAELKRHSAGQAAAQRDYLRQFDRFVSRLRRDMRRRAIKQRLRRLASEAFGRPSDEG